MEHSNRRLYEPRPPGGQELDSPGPPALSREPPQGSQPWMPLPPRLQPGRRQSGPWLHRAQLVEGPARRQVERLR